MPSIPQHEQSITLADGPLYPYCSISCIVRMNLERADQPNTLASFTSRVLRLIISASFCCPLFALSDLSHRRCPPNLHVGKPQSTWYDHMDHPHPQRRHTLPTKQDSLKEPHLQERSFHFTVHLKSLSVQEILRLQFALAPREILQESVS